MDVLNRVPVREQEPKVRAKNFEEVCYGYSLEDTAVKECWEETGVQINKKMLRNRGTNSSHVNGSVNTTFTTILNGVTTDYILTNKNCEPGEVTDVKWIPIS